MAIVRYCHRFAARASLALGLLGLGCEGAKTHATTTFYERRIGPILTESCANSPTQSGCHVAADTHGNAFGNLNVASYDTLEKRRDLLIPYGPYSMPALLVKVLPPFQVRITTWENTDPIIVTTDIAARGGLAPRHHQHIVQHAIDLDLSRSDGEQRDSSPEGSRTDALSHGSRYGSPVRSHCRSHVGSAAPDYTLFSSQVNPVLGGTCAAGNCHGSPSNSLYLTCGTTPEQTRWNYFAAGDYVSADPRVE